MCVSYACGAIHNGKFGLDKNVYFNSVYPYYKLCRVFRGTQKIILRCVKVLNSKEVRILSVASDMLRIDYL